MERKKGKERKWAKNGGKWKEKIGKNREREKSKKKQVEKMGRKNGKTNFVKKSKTTKRKMEKKIL